MKTHLLPNYFKKIGLILFFFGFIAGVLTYGVDDFKAGYRDGVNAADGKESPKVELAETHEHFGKVWTEGWIRFFDLCNIAGILIYALSGEKREDEMYRTLRLETGWLTFVIWLFFIFIIYSIWGELKMSLSYVLTVPLLLFLVMFFFRKRNMA